MIRRLVLVVSLLALVSSPAWAQVEIAGFAGYRTGASSNPDAGELDRIGVSKGVTYGAMFDVLFQEGMGFEFLWSHQNTDVSARLRGQTMSHDLFESSADTFLFNFLYHWNEDDDAFRPFVLGGLGWTRFGPKDVDVDSISKFAFDIGGGFKYYATDNVGFRFDARFQPTYVSSSDNLWCDPFICYNVPSAHYFSQFEFTGAFLLRF